jgi:Mg2+/Co2+ transporter CorB
MPLTTGVVFGMVVVVILLFCSAMISGSEVAFFSLGPQHLNAMKERSSRKEKMVLKLLEKPERLLANILISNNFINVGIVIIAAHVTNSLLDFSDHPVLGFVTQVIVITFLLLLFGEIMPKVYANRFAAPFANRMVVALTLLDRVFHPLIKLLIRSTRAVKRKLEGKGQNISMEDLSEALDLTTGVVQDQKDMLEGIVRFSNLEVSEIMKPRTDVVTVDIETEL